MENWRVKKFQNSEKYYVSGEIRDHLGGIAHRHCFEAEQGYASGVADMCHACRHDIGAESGPCIVVGKNKYHEECFVCSECKCSLAGRKFMRSNNRRYCHNCQWATVTIATAATITATMITITTIITATISYILYISLVAFIAKVFCLLENLPRGGLEPTQARYPSYGKRRPYQLSYSGLPLWFILAIIFSIFHLWR